MKYISLFLLIILSSSCVTLSDLKDMRDQLDKEDIIENITTINEILEEDNIDDPYFFWSALDTSAYISTKGQLHQKDKILFERLTSNYVNIIIKPPSPESNEDWVSNGFELNNTKEDISKNAIEYLDQTTNHIDASYLIKALDEFTNSNKLNTNVHRYLLYVVYQNLNKIKTSAHKKDLLSILAKTTTLQNDDEVNKFIVAIKDEIIDLKLLIDILNDHKKYFDKIRNLEALIGFNEIYWEKLILNNIKYDYSELIKNANQISFLSSANKNLILNDFSNFDFIPEQVSNKIINDKANNLIKNFIPEMYFRKIILEAQTNEDRLLESHEIKPTIRIIRRQQNENKSTFIFKRRPIFNSLIINGLEYQKENDRLLKNTTISSIQDKIYINDKKYKYKLLSSILLNYPEELLEFLINNFKNKKQNISIIQDEFLYSFLLIEQINEHNFIRLKDSILDFIYNNILDYNEREMHLILNENINFFVKYFEQDFLNTLNKIILERKLETSKQDIITKFLLITLNNFENKINIFKFKQAFSSLFNLQNEVVTKRLLGYLEKRNPNQTVSIYVDSLFSKNMLNLKLFNFIYLSQFGKKNMTNLDEIRRNKIFLSFFKNLNNPDEEISLTSYSNSLYFNLNSVENDVILKKLKDKYKF